jgi:hypothetical protein
MNKFEKELHVKGLERIESKLTNACELRIELQKMYLNGKKETEAYKELNKKYYYALMDWANDYVIANFMKSTDLKTVDDLIKEHMNELNALVIEREKELKSK